MLVESILLFTYYSSLFLDLNNCYKSFFSHPLIYPKYPDLLIFHDFYPEICLSPRNDKYIKNET